MKYIIANWKAHKSLTEARNWMENLLAELPKNTHLVKRLEEQQVCLIICPPDPLIFPLRHYTFSQHNIFIGAQTLSHFESGSYTGETTAQSLAEFTRYAIIGHSERRHFFHETEEEILQKLILAVRYEIEPIHCVRGETDKIHALARIVAYEPDTAIGTGANASVNAVVDMRRRLKLNEHCHFLYGGSVTQYNCKEYLEHPEIAGLLIGSASLDPLHFLAIAEQA